jgi:Ca2+-binding EF-hand superfamily protein
MTAPKKTVVAVLVLMGAALGSAALADRGMGGMGGMGGPGGPGAMLMENFDAIDTNKDGKITQDEIAAHRAAEFAAADTNGDGQLDAEELAAQMLKQMLARQAARMIENLDDDGNGALSTAEMREGPMSRNFARIDTDNDGAISKEEAQAAFAKVGKRKDGRRQMKGNFDN